MYQHRRIFIIPTIYYCIPIIIKPVALIGAGLEGVAKYEFMRRGSVVVHCLVDLSFATIPSLFKVQSLYNLLATGEVLTRFQRIYILPIACQQTFRRGVNGEINASNSTVAE